jgi:hypothetical protein
MSADPKRSAESLKIELLDKASRWAVPGSCCQRIELPTYKAAPLQLSALRSITRIPNECHDSKPARVAVFSNRCRKHAESGPRRRLIGPPFI